MSDITARSIAELGLPRFRTKRARMHDGKELYFVTTPGEKIVGVVVQGQELGPIVFTDLFIERFPKLRQVTVVREATHQYVYRSGAPKTTFAEAADLPQPPRSHLYCSLVLCALIAQRYGIDRALAQVWGRRDAALILAFATALLMVRSLKFNQTVVQAVIKDRIDLSIGPDTLAKLIVFEARIEEYGGLLSQKLLGDKSTALTSFVLGGRLYFAPITTGIPYAQRRVEGNSSAAVVAYQKEIKRQALFLVDRGLGRMRMVNNALARDLACLWALPESWEITAKLKSYVCIHRGSGHQLDASVKCWKSPLIKRFILRGRGGTEYPLTLRLFYDAKIEAQEQQRLINLGVALAQARNEGRYERLLRKNLAMQPVVEFIKPSKGHWLLSLSAVKQAAKLKAITAFATNRSNLKMQLLYQAWSHYEQVSAALHATRHTLTEYEKLPHFDLIFWVSCQLEQGLRQVLNDIDPTKSERKLLQVCTKLPELFKFINKADPAYQGDENCAFGLTEAKRNYLAQLGFEVQESREYDQMADLATQALAVLLKFK